jgi:hypothetical protein
MEHTFKIVIHNNLTVDRSKAYVAALLANNCKE